MKQKRKDNNNQHKQSKRSKRTIQHLETIHDFDLFHSNCNGIQKYKTKNSKLSRLITFRMEDRNIQLMHFTAEDLWQRNNYKDRKISYSNSLLRKIFRDGMNQAWNKECFYDITYNSSQSLIIFIGEESDETTIMKVMYRVAIFYQVDPIVGIIITGIVSNEKVYNANKSITTKHNDMCTCLKVLHARAINEMKIDLLIVLFDCDDNESFCFYRSLGFHIGTIHNFNLVHVLPERTMSHLFNAELQLMIFRGEFSIKNSMKLLVEKNRNSTTKKDDSLRCEICYVKNPTFYCMAQIKCPFAEEISQPKAKFRCSMTLCIICQSQFGPIDYTNRCPFHERTSKGKKFQNHS